MRWIRMVLLLGLCWCVSGCININAPVLPKFGWGDSKDSKDKKDKNDKNDKDDEDDEDDERKDNSSSSQLPAPHLPTTVTGTRAAAGGATPSPIGANPWTWPAGSRPPATSAASRA